MRQSVTVFYEYPSNPELFARLSCSGIVADPRVTIGGVAYELPVAHRRGRPSVFRLESNAIGLLKGQREKEKRRLLELKIKMCRAQERRDVRLDVTA